VLHRQRSGRLCRKRRRGRRRRRRWLRFRLYLRLYFNPLFHRRRRDRRSSRLYGFNGFRFFDNRGGRHFNLGFRNGNGFDVLFFNLRFFPRNYFIPSIHSKFAAQLIRKAVFDRIRMGRHRDAHVLQFADDLGVVAIQLSR
jgi:hypothetical protein